MRLRRLIATTLAGVAAVLGVSLLVGSGRAQGEGRIRHTCSAADRQFLNTVSSNMVQLGYWSDQLAQGDVAPGVVFRQAKAEALQVNATRPTDPSLERARGLLRSMFDSYARAVYVRTHGGNAGVPMRTAYMLANGVHDLLAQAQPDIAPRGCDPAPLLR